MPAPPRPRRAAGAGAGACDGEGDAEEGDADEDAVWRALTALRDGGSDDDDAQRGPLPSQEHSPRGAGGLWCAHCGAEEGEMVARDGNVECGRCHSLVGRQLDYGAEWRNHGADESHRGRGASGGVFGGGGGGGASAVARCGPPSNGLLSSLGSVVAGAPRRQRSTWANRTEAVAAQAEVQRRSCQAVQRQHAWGALTYRERVLCGVFDSLAAVAARHGLPSCLLEEAKALYARVSDEHITRGESRTAIIAASMYVACKKCGAPRSHREVSAMFGLRAGALTKACRLFQSIVRDADHESSVPSDFVGRFCAQMALPPRAVALTRQVVDRADDMAVVCDVTPPSVVAGAMQLVCDELGLAVRREAIAAACVVSCATVSKIRRRLLPHREALLADP